MLQCTKYVALQHVPCYTPSRAAPLRPRRILDVSSLNLAALQGAAFFVGTARPQVPGRVRISRLLPTKNAGAG